MKKRPDAERASGRGFPWGRLAAQKETHREAALPGVSVFSRSLPPGESLSGFAPLGVEAVLGVGLDEQQLLAELGGDTAVISVGFNSYGHPAEETLERLALYGYNVYRTDKDGTVEIRIG